MADELNLNPLSVSEEAEIQANVESSPMLKRLYGAFIGALKTKTSVKKAEITFCHHHHVYVREQSRDLECQRCGKAISAFDWLRNRARAEDRLFWRRKNLQQQIDRLEERLEVMKRDERNTKARVRRIQAKEA